MTEIINDSRWTSENSPRKKFLLQTLRNCITSARYWSVLLGSESHPEMRKRIKKNIIQNGREINQWLKLLAKSK